MTALIARDRIDGTKADTANGVNVANFLAGTGNAWDCLQTLGVGVTAIAAGTATLTQANAGLCLVDASGGAVVINLPACSAAVGALFQFKRIDTTANTVTINRAGGDTIDGQTSYVLSEQFDFVEMRGDGASAWRALNNTAVAAKENLTAGTSTAYTLTPTPALNAYKAGRSYWVNFHVASGAAPTLQISGLASPPNLVMQVNGSFVNVGPGGIPIGYRGRVTLVSATQALVEGLVTTAVFSGVRQTVQSGAVDSSGFPTFLATSASLLMPIAATAVPLVLSAANGFNASGPVDRIGIQSADTSLTLAASSSLFIYADISAAGVLTFGSGTLLPNYISGGTPSIVSGQFTFDYTKMIGYVGNGASAVQTHRTYLGEATTSGTAVTAVVNYALNGRYEGAFTATLPAAGVTTSFNHNIGTHPTAKTLITEVTTADFGYSIGEQINVFPYGSSTGGTPNLASTRNAIAITAGLTNAWAVVRRDSGEVNIITNRTSYRYKLMAQRGW